MLVTNRGTQPQQNETKCEPFFLFLRIYLFLGNTLENVGGEMPATSSGVIEFNWALPIVDILHTAYWNFNAVSSESSAEVTISVIFFVILKDSWIRFWWFC